MNLLAPEPWKLAILFDFPEEGWPSMDLAAGMLVEAVPRVAQDVAAKRVAPSFLRIFGRLPLVDRSRAAFNGDRLWNRMLRYPRYVRRSVDSFDAFHVADHSYAHLAHSLPPGRTGVFCHDLDAFRSFIEPEKEPRPAWFRAVTRRILSGLQRAAVVFHSTEAVRQAILDHRLVPAGRLVHAPYGIASEFNPSGTEAGPLPAGLDGGRYLLHVGSCIPRKRIDVLLETFAAARRARPGTRLVQVGGEWSGEQLGLIDLLGIGDAVTQLRGLDRRALADLYRGAALLLQPSSAEGFGLPVVEALACGTPVLASDIPALREVGGDAATYCPPGDFAAWARTAVALLAGDLAPQPVEARLARAATFSWDGHARIVVDAYRELLRQARPA